MALRSAMYDPTFHTQNLHREITSDDYLRDRRLFTDGERDRVVSEAKNRITNGYNGVRLSNRMVNGSTVYCLDEISDELALRKVGRNIKLVTGVRPTNRKSIIKCLNRLAQEGVSFRIYKIDIKKFYESVSTSLFIESISEDSAFSLTTTQLLRSFFEATAEQGISGLPRGLALSSVLSEYVMRSFDSTVSKIDGVHFYSRFVDDMIFVTRGDESARKFMQDLKTSLPEGLNLNAAKTRHFDFLAFDKTAAAGIEGAFDFLGYSFNISRARRQKDGRIGREIQVDIAQKKVRRIKSRICITFLEYLKDGNFQDLTNRIRMLCGNYSLYERGNRSLRKAGIFHSYHLIGPQKSKALDDLDKFYRRMILSSTGKICGPLAASLTNRQKQSLLKYSFVRGFYERVYFSFSHSDVSGLRRCWTNA